jgi:glycosyltransferase involved in cell wall biosynthesis
MLTQVLISVSEGAAGLAALWHACYTTPAAMNIVMIGPFGLRPKGTMAVRALPLARALAGRGHRVCVVMPPWSFPADSGQVFSAGDVQVINIALPRKVPGLWHLAVVWRLVRAALAQQPDLIHCFKPKAYSGVVALLIWLAQRLRLTRVHLVVDTDDWEGYGGWNDIERYSHVQKAIFARQEHWGLRHAQALTVASRTLQSIVWSLGVPPTRVFYIPNGAWSATTADSTTPRSTILLYTRFFEFAVERAVAIIAGVLREHPQARVVVVGAGLFGEEERFMAQVTSAGLAGSVTYAGWVDASALPGYFAAAAVAIYPFDDTLINRTKCAVKLTDLLAAGVPVVADRVGQNCEYIENGVSGLLVKAGDIDAFVGAVGRVLNDAELQRRLSEGARRRMTDQFSWERLATQVEDAYKHT